MVFRIFYGVYIYFSFTSEEKKSKKTSKKIANNLHLD